MLSHRCVQNEGVRSTLDFFRLHRRLHSVVLQQTIIKALHSRPLRAAVIEDEVDPT